MIVSPAAPVPPPTPYRRPTSRPSVDAVVHALLYGRVSSDEQAKKGVSLEAQHAEVWRYAAERQWVIAGEYRDVMKGTRDDRPHYQRLLSDVRRMRAEGKPVVVIVAALDRLGRRVLERVRAREELKAIGVTTHSVREGGEVSDLQANILASVAEEEVRRLGERVAASWDHIRGGGWAFVGRVPFGYLLRDATDAERLQGAPKRVLDVDPVAGPYVADAFDRAAAGESFWSISLSIAALPDSVRRGRIMSHQVVRTMLKAPVYISRRQVGAGPDRRDQQDADVILASPPQRWPRLTDDDKWYVVQQRFATARRLTPQASGTYLLTGFLRCPKCGGRMASRVEKPGSPRGRSRYVCTSKSKGAWADATAPCTMSVTMAPVDEAVRAEVVGLLEALLNAKPAVRKAVERAWRTQSAPADDAARAAQVTALERSIAQAKKQLADAALAKLAGTLNDVAYAAAQEQLTADLDRATHALTQLQLERPRPAERLPDFGDVLAAAGSWARIFAEAPISDQREALAELVATVVPTREARGKYGVTIEPTPLGRKLRDAVASIA